MENGQATRATDVSQLLSELDAGKLEAQLGHALSICGGAAFDHAGEAKVTLHLTLKRQEGGSQILVASEMSYRHPTNTGTKLETCKAKTLMHVGKGGRLTFMPENQIDMFKAAAQNMPSPANAPAAASL